MNKARPLAPPVKKARDKLDISLRRLCAGRRLNECKTSPFGDGALSGNIVPPIERMAIRMPGGNEIIDVLQSKRRIA